MRDSIGLIVLQQGEVFNLRDWLEAGQGLALLEKQQTPCKGFLLRTERQYQELIADLKASPFRALFIHIGIGQHQKAHELLTALEESNCPSTIALGGLEGTICCQEFTSYSLVKMIMLGEWTEAICEFASEMLRHGFARDIPGTLFPRQEGWVTSNQRLYKPNLFTWPAPSLDDLRARDVIRLRAGSAPILASRGFPFKTLFSNDPYLRHLQKTDFHYYMRPIGRITEEAQHLHQEYSARSFYFADDLFPWTDRWLKDFAKAWKEKVNLPFTIKSACEYITEETIQLLRQAGLDSVELCVECGNEPLRQQLADLNQTNERIYTTIKTLNIFHIKSTLHLMLGVPGETKQSLKETVQLARQSGATHLRPMRYSPIPDTPQWQSVEAMMTGGELAARPELPLHPQENLDTEIQLAKTQIEEIESKTTVATYTRHGSAILDGLADFETSVINSPLEMPAKIDEFSSPGGTHEVIALRVPSEITWELDFPSENPILGFGILLKPGLPGERLREAISFSVRVAQDGESYRVFQKIALQALDPDSRRWHWFKMPLGVIKKGSGSVTLENIVYGEEKGTIPQSPVWAGWAKVLVTSDEQDDKEDQTAPHRFAYTADQKEESYY